MEDRRIAQRMRDARTRAAGRKASHERQYKTNRRRKAAYAESLLVYAELEQRRLSKQQGTTAAVPAET